MPHGPRTPSLLAAACALACTAAIAACGDSYERPSGADLGGTTTTGRAAESRERGGSSGSAASRRAARRKRGHGADGARHSRPLPAPARREAALIRSLVRQLIEGLNRRDPSTCTRLFSQHLVPEPKRAEAVSRCRRQVARTGAKVRLAEIEVMEIGRPGKTVRSLVQFVTTTKEGHRRRHRFHLIRSGEAYKVDGVYRVKQP